MEMRIHQPGHEQMPTAVDIPHGLIGSRCHSVGSGVGVGPRLHRDDDIVLKGHRGARVLGAYRIHGEHPGVAYDCLQNFAWNDKPIVCGRKVYPWMIELICGDCRMVRSSNRFFAYSATSMLPKPTPALKLVTL